MPEHRKPFEELTDEEKRIVEILNERRREILSEFREILLKNDLDLHVVGLRLDEHEMDVTVEETGGCCCMEPPGGYAIPCSACGWG